MNEKPYATVGPILYGENPAQTLTVDYYPDGPPRAAVVWISGWTAGTFGKQQEMPPLYRSLGVAFVRLGHRPAGKFRHPVPLEDTIAGLKFLRQNAKRWNIDPNRMAVSGNSAGGHLAMLAAYCADAPKLAAVVEHNAPTNFDPRFLKSINPEMVKLPAFELLFGEIAKDGDSNAMRDKLREFSPVNHMSPDDPPTLFLARRHGAPPQKLTPQWGNHHHRFAQHGFEQMKKAGGEAELCIAELGQKGVATERAAEAAFLTKHLGVGASRDPRQPMDQPISGIERGGRDGGVVSGVSSGSRRKVPSEAREHELAPTRK